MADRRVIAVVGVGANLGDAQVTVTWAIELLSGLSNGPVNVSRLFGSAPVEATGPDFVNAVVQFATQLTAPDLLRELQRIELQAGRVRPYRNAPRTLDLDLLLYGDAHIDSGALTVPHPRMWQRAFVVVPLAEVAPERVSAAALLGVSDQAVWPL